MVLSVTWMQIWGGTATTFISAESSLGWEPLLSEDLPRDQPKINRQQEVPVFPA